MARLLIHVEGQTEESFVVQVLRPYLFSKGYQSVTARLLGNARLRSHRGGARSWDAVRGDIIRHLHGDSKCFATIMVDYYGMPGTGSKAWPGRQVAETLPYGRRAPTVEQAIVRDLSRELGFDLRRFVPFVVMHEFEGLLFSDCQSLASAIGRIDLANSLNQIRASFASPEEINDSPQTAPSKRLLALQPSYQKTLHGPIAAEKIGLSSIRAVCPNFDQWLTRLEALIDL